MKDKKKPEQQSRLRAKIEKTSGEYYPGEDKPLSEVEEFVIPIIEEFKETAELEPFSLKTQEGAAAALPMLEQKLADLKQQREKISKVKTLLNQRKFDLENMEIEDEV